MFRIFSLSVNIKVKHSTEAEKLGQAAGKGTGATNIMYINIP